ncbi:TPA: hypothetical protein N0F65_002218 [Lagenidium giganteum]|uniref:Site-specific DNA-methyltransferase (adenine-specific) n=1 Tax=Lagenidium giganteum TaxID=4803 RepID=A0AAV2YW12_9STRA|nr:TPA: hypothetical protein N0F65_002218 [Lagenidium giganteum]
MAALELIGYDAATKRFVLTTVDGHGEFLREFSDLQSWDRRVGRQAWLQRLPTPRFKKLMAHSWRKNDDSSGWRIELKKNVAACECWINSVFQVLDEHAQNAFVRDELYDAERALRLRRHREELPAKELQQYFTNQPLMDMVLAQVDEYMSSHGLDWQSDDVDFLEPSCGDGRFVRALAAKGARHVFAWELDRDFAKQAQASAPPQTTITQGDFLGSRDPRAAAAQRHLIVVGNPPFSNPSTAPPGTPDLLLRFFAHLEQFWTPNAIVFILPARCAKQSFVDLALAALGPGQWSLASAIDVADSVFEFRGVKAYKQPSVVHVYTTIR